MTCKRSCLVSWDLCILKSRVCYNIQQNTSVPINCLQIHTACITANGYSPFCFNRPLVSVQIIKQQFEFSEMSVWWIGLLRWIVTISGVLLINFIYTDHYERNGQLNLRHASCWLLSLTLTAVCLMNYVMMSLLYIKRYLIIYFKQLWSDWL